MDAVKVVEMGHVSQETKGGGPLAEFTASGGVAPAPIE